jgi:hypothetical protein
MRLHQLATVAISSVLALVGMAGVAHASATIDLIWIDKTDPACTDASRRDCPQLGDVLSSVANSDQIGLAVLATAGPGGLLGAGVSVDYSGGLPILSVVDFGSLETPVLLTNHLGTTTNQPPFVDNINSVAVPYLGAGIGLPPGQTAYLGTVSFHKYTSMNGVFEIAVGADGPVGTDGVLRLSDFADITPTTTFNNAFVVDIIGDPFPCTDPQGFSMEIEVNALRAGGKTVQAGPGRTVDVTAKARILKGTAVPGTTLDTTLRIEAVDGTGVVDTETSGSITLGVGKGGKGDKLTLDTTRCDGGYLTFVATFYGVDMNGDSCEGVRQLRKECK